MDRRQFLSLGPLAGLALDNRAEAAPPPFQGEKSKLKITSVRLVDVRPRRPVPSYTPTPGSFSAAESEVANPMSIYPEYKPRRSLFNPDRGKLGGFTVEIGTDKGVKGYGAGGMGGGHIVTGHLTKLLLGEDPFNVEAHLGHLMAVHDVLRPHGRDHECHQRSGPRPVGRDRQRPGNFIP